MATYLSTDSARCVVLVPVGSSIDPQCDAGLQELERRGYAVRRSYGCSAIDFGRSFLASSALVDGFDEIMWIDSDIGFNPNDVDKLRNHGLPFCCGLYVAKGGKRFACNFLPDSPPATFGVGGGLLEILNTGFGFVHTRREAYDKIKNNSQLPECHEDQSSLSMTPYFLPELLLDGFKWRYLTEDLAFCHRARKAGCNIMADTSVRLMHIGRHPFSWEDYFAHQTRSVK